MNVNQMLISQTGGTGVAGDKYVGLDLVGRVIDDLWLNTSTSTTTDELQYGYNQLLTFARGTLNSTDTAITGTASRTQNFATNAVGDFTSITTNGTATTETSNAQNEVTGISGATTPTYDANGNMTTDETGRKFVFDAWKRCKAARRRLATSGRRCT